MLNEFKHLIKKATKAKKLDKILTQAKEMFGFLSDDYNKVLNLCWERLMQITNK